MGVWVDVPVGVFCFMLIDWLLSNALFTRFLGVRGVQLFNKLQFYKQFTVILNIAFYLTFFDFLVFEKKSILKIFWIIKKSN